MQAIIDPGYINGKVKIPASKSIMQRACACALLHPGKTIIQNPGHSDDDRTALNIIQQLGAQVISETNDTIEIKSGGLHPISNSIDCKESGLAARLFIPIASLHFEQVGVHASGSLLNRTMEEFGSVLPQLGVQLEEFNGYLPFKVKGPLQAKNISINGDVSSQFLSGLLFALCAAAHEDPISIEVSDLKSKPYIDLTLDILKKFGYSVTNNDYRIFHCHPELYNYQYERTIKIEGDWSSAACWLVGGAIAGDVKLEGLQQDSLQADKKLLEILAIAGANVETAENALHVQSSVLNEFEFDATDCPDLFPVLSILAAKCNGESYIKGIHRLWHKESNRIESITEMLHQFGVNYSIEDDALCIRGRMKFEYATIDSYNDHRIVMAAAIAALHAKGPVTILGAEAVNKSYPDFFKDLISLGVGCTLKND